MEATDIREDTGCIVLRYCLSTGVVLGFGDTQFNFCRMYTESEIPTVTDIEDSRVI